MKCLDEDVVKKLPNYEAVKIYISTFPILFLLRK